MERLLKTLTVAAVALTIVSPSAGAATTTLECRGQGNNCYEAKLAIVRHAIRAYLTAPSFLLVPTA